MTEVPRFFSLLPSHFAPLLLLIERFLFVFLESSNSLLKGIWL
ncbi:hypothetical protein CSC36_3724 [Pseudomonas aeruginosa]|nr:hypothetical protein CSC36_3724 [Pseudomonas aeruginosa]